MCEDIWKLLQTTYHNAKITQLEIAFRKRALTWYMKYKVTTPTSQTRTLTEIKCTLMKDFPKSIRVAMYYKDKGN